MPSSKTKVGIVLRSNGTLKFANVGRFFIMLTAIYVYLAILVLERRFFETMQIFPAQRCMLNLVFYRWQCNVRQKTLQKFLKISIENSKCATSNKHIQDGRPGRYENRRGSKIKAKHPKKTSPPPRNMNVRDVITQKARESGILPSDSKKTGFWQKSAK